MLLESQEKRIIRGRVVGRHKHAAGIARIPGQAHDAARKRHRGVLCSIRIEAALFPPGYWPGGRKVRPLPQVMAPEERVPAARRAVAWRWPPRALGADAIVTVASASGSGLIATTAAAGAAAPAISDAAAGSAAGGGAAQRAAAALGDAEGRRSGLQLALMHLKHHGVVAILEPDILHIAVRIIQQRVPPRGCGLARRLVPVLQARRHHCAAPGCGGWSAADR